jgi:hypothetical protein
MNIHFFKWINLQKISIRNKTNNWDFIKGTDVGIKQNVTSIYLHSYHGNDAQVQKPSHFKT